MLTVNKENIYIQNIFSLIDNRPTRDNDLDLLKLICCLHLVNIQILTGYCRSAGRKQCHL